MTFSLTHDLDNHLDPWDYFTLVLMQAARHQASVSRQLVHNDENRLSVCLSVCVGVEAILNPSGQPTSLREKLCKSY